MTISLDGLTKRQVELCDMLWKCDTDSEVLDLAMTLPSDEAYELAILQELICQEAMEEQISLMDRYPDAEAMIERLKKDYL